MERVDLTIVLDDDVSQSKLDEITSHAIEQIREMPVDNVQRAKSSATPDGSRGDAMTIGTIVVSLASAGVFQALFEFLKTWVGRGNERKVTVSVKLDGRELSLTYSPNHASEEEMAEFVRTVADVLKE